MHCVCLTDFGPDGLGSDTAKGCGGDVTDCHHRQLSIWNNSEVVSPIKAT